ncbi:hypothetical protein OSB04_008460 [Centaurea solstitialis]|uniref:CCR4-NOT transcription complex subunit 1 n=1 Tax=Centaurea solstitialis TaxID=347529 RepID=A0AA38WRF5_9ASTR|nr:hypothetical protein OSB04_008460 [Centaurea solstitialis]
MASFAKRIAGGIRKLLESLNEDNYDDVVHKLSEYIEYGTEESILLVQTCLDHFKIYEEDLKSTNLEPVVASLFRKLLEKPHFSRVFSGFVRRTSVSKEFLDNLSSAMQLSAYEKLGFGLALSESERNDVRTAVIPSSPEINRSFPIAAVCDDVWKNTEGQLPFMQHALTLSPDASMFAHFRRELQYEDAEDDDKFHADHANHPWLCIDNLENLCLLAESGRETLVRSMLEVPLKHCPEVLLIGMAHIITPCNLLQHEVSSVVLPSLLKDDSKSEVVLNLWHVNPLFFSRALKDALNSDPEITNRVVNLLEDLEILSSVLDLVPMSLGIRLAALASVKEFIDLEEWLSTNLSIYEDSFFEECLRFLKVLKADAQDSSEAGEILSAYKETIPTFLKVLQLHTSLLSSNQLSEEVESLYVTPMDDSQTTENIGDANSSASEIYAEDIETEVNFYFQQMFSNQLTVDAMVQKLTQFKESSEKREQSVFECMINNLFEVYKFINKYPDEQLQIVAVLFGFLIKHRFVSHPILDISLQAVLDALHEPADSKMFLFGTKALESFVDCLIEWPEYSQEILQISHLHLTHSKLVLVINQTLACTSSSHPESDEGHNSGTNQHHSSNPPENVEMPASSLPLTGADGAQIDSQVSSEALPLTGADGAQIDSQVCSPIQQHQTNEIHMDEKQKSSLTSSSDTDPNLSDSRQVSVTSSGSVSIQKPQNVVKSSAETSSSPGFSSNPPENVEKFESNILHDFAYLFLEYDRFSSISPIQQHQTNESHMDEKQKASLTSSSDTNPNLTNSRQVSVTSSGSVSIQKVSIVLSVKPYGYVLSLPQFRYLSLDFQNLLPITFLHHHASMQPQNVVKPSQKRLPLLVLVLHLEQSPQLLPFAYGAQKCLFFAGFGSASSIGTLLAAAERRVTPIEAPPSETQDRIFFIINNLSSTNIEVKAKEFTEILEEQYYPWFGHYIVMKRASIEPNFHMLYLNLLEKVKSTHLNEEVVQATYENCKVLLRSELIKSSVEERSLLKNLGGWLGRITIGRNRVLRARDIDPKSLLLEILEQCRSSLAYQPPNPWTMAILGLLAEIHSMPNLKVNLKFEIEVLNKNLDMDLKAVTPTSLLEGRVRKFEDNPDFSTKDVGSFQQHIVEEANTTVRSDVNQVELPPEAVGPSYQGDHSHVVYQHAAPLRPPAVMLGEDEKMETLDLGNQLPPAIGQQVAQLPFPVIQVSAPTLNLSQQVNANPDPQPSDLDMQFQRFYSSLFIAARNLSGLLHYLLSVIVLFCRVLPLAMDNAIKEIVSSIEYDTESNENCILEASFMMVVHLAGNLAYVTCKEPLRRSISTQLRNLLQGSYIGSEVLEESIEHVIDDNLDLGCASIEKAATDKGITMVQSELARQLPLRRKQREGDRTATVDPDPPTQSNVGAIPEPFYPRSVRISHPQQQVYEGFVPLPVQNFSQPPNIFVAVPLVPQFGGPIPLGYALGSGQLNPGIFSSHLGNSEVNENEGLLPSFPAPQSHVSEPLNVDKELGISEQPILPPTGSESFTRNTVEPPLTTDAVLNIYQFLSKKLEFLIATDAKEAEIQLTASLENTFIFILRGWLFSVVIAEVPKVILRGISKDEAALAVAQKVFECLYENANNNAHVDAYLAILAAICDVSQPVGKELTSWVLLSDDDRKFHIDITVGLIHRELLNLSEYNVHMAKLIDAGKKGIATEFCISLIQTLQASDARVISELHNVIDALAKATNPPAGMDDDFASESSKHDFADFHGQVSVLLIEWLQICDLPGVDDAPRAHYVLQLNRNVLSKADDMPDRFFCVLLEICVSHYLVSEGINSSQPQMSQQAERSSFLVIDLYADLVFSILEVLAVIVKFIKKDVEEKKASFYPYPYVRLFKNFLLHVNSLDSVIKDANFQVLTALSNSFHALQPMKVPAFSFAWLELVSHRYFMPIMLTTNDQKGWPYFERLMIDWLQFMEPLLRTGEIAEPVRVLYKGTLRVLLVLLHDFPEFLACYYFSFCDVIAPRCIQLRNIILSAFPKMRIPDPNTPKLKVDLLVEMSQPPCILSEFDAVLKANKLKRGVDEYLMIRPEESLFLSELKYKLHLSSREAERRGTSYNVPLMNSLVLYIGTQAIQQIQASTASYATCIARCMELSVLFAGAALDIFRTLILELDSEGRYVFFNAVANQLRYPNNHTHYFSFVMLYFFTELNQEPIQEVITRVLLERLMTKRPHPWGALVTFLELVKNEKYNFWNLSFTKCAPEIEKLFESVSVSCGLKKPEDEASGSGAP